MINPKYKKWIIKHWLLENGLITQAIAAKILGKTPTRIRQMINENKLKSFLYNDETPLVSMRETLQIYEREEKKEWEINQALYEMQLTESEKAGIEFEKEQEEKESEIFVDSLSPEELEKMEAMKEIEKEQEKEYQELKTKRDKIEEEIAIMETKRIGQS